MKSLQKTILKNKHSLLFFTGPMIILAFIFHYAFDLHTTAVLLLFIASIFGALPIWIQAYQSLKVKVVSIDVLVSLAIFGAFLIKNYEEAAIVAFLFLFGSFLEQRTLEKTRSAIQELVALAPSTAYKQTSKGTFEEVSIEDVEVGNILLVKTGDSIPVDGIIVQGDGHVNEASITGESFPVSKHVTQPVYAGSILENGTLQIQAESVGEDTTFGKIIELVEEAQDAKSDTERFIDRFSKHYTPIVLLLAIIVGLISKDLELAVTILVLGCPGALVIGVPVSNVAGIGRGAVYGVLLKGSDVIQRFQKVDTMLFDKTGTLTIGNPEVAEDFYYGNDKHKSSQYLKSIEQESTHPLAQALVSYLQDTITISVSSTNVLQGRGLETFLQDQQVLVGNEQLMNEFRIPLNEQQLQDIQTLQAQGNSIVLLAIDGKLERLFGIKDQIRPGVKEDLQQLQQMGIQQLIMLSGDNQQTVDLVSKELGLTKAIGHCLPEDKADYVKQLQKQGHVVAFVGDGVNDSPSLALADIGIAMGGGTDVAIETSDVVLMNSSFHKLPFAYGLAKATARNMKQNIVIAIATVLVLLASVFFSDWMNMAIGMFVHEGSILVVILNGMRLLRYSKNLANLD